jgi:membrane protease YdiL (CAAX protease family)
MSPELTQSLEAFGPWDWLCVGINLALALTGIYAVRCWRRLPAVETMPAGPVFHAATGLGTAVLAFGLIFPVTLQLAAGAFATTFGISQAHVYTAAFIGQATAAAAMLAVGLSCPGTLHWAPLTAAADHEGRGFRSALKAFSFPRVLLAILCIFTLGLACTLAWKGIHLGWEQLFLHGWAGQPPADEPQDIVNSVLKTDVASWRFATIAVAVVIGAPVMEELAFRGMLYPGLRQLGDRATPRHARAVAVILTGAIFSAAHMSPSAALPLFGFGAFMCLVRDRFGLVTCMAVHASFNLWNLVWLKLAPNAANL